jgi:hypothetical protein
MRSCGLADINTQIECPTDGALIEKKTELTESQPIADIADIASTRRGENNPLTCDIAHIADIAESEGVGVLDALDDFLARFVAYPSDEARHAHVLWIAHTWRMDIWDSTPRIAFMSPEKGSGKTRALEVSEHLVHQCVRVSNATTAYVVAKVSSEPTPTLFYDEIDTVYGPKAHGNEELRSVLNAGHRRGATIGRGSWSEGRIIGQDFPAYCAVALAGLGKLPDTVADRAVVVPMKKRKATEHVEPWRERDMRSTTDVLAEALERWTAKLEALPWPTDMPVHDRDADVWEPLVMIADAAGGHWPSRARAAALVLTSDDANASEGVQLLRDLRTVFDGHDKLSSVAIVTALAELPEAPWATYHANGTPLNQRDLAKGLAKYGLRSCDIWLPNTGRSVKGYKADDLRDAWGRY